MKWPLLAAWVWYLEPTPELSIDRVPLIVQEDGSFRGVIAKPGTVYLVGLCEMLARDIILTPHPLFVVVGQIISHHGYVEISP